MSRKRSQLNETIRILNGWSGRKIPLYIVGVRTCPEEENFVRSCMKQKLRDIQFNLRYHPDWPDGIADRTRWENFVVQVDPTQKGYTFLKRPDPI